MNTVKLPESNPKSSSAAPECKLICELTDNALSDLRAELDALTERIMPVLSTAIPPCEDEPAPGHASTSAMSSAMTQHLILIYAAIGTVRRLTRSAAI